jgi:hypothetical protein
MSDFSMTSSVMCAAERMAIQLPWVYCSVINMTNFALSAALRSATVGFGGGGFSFFCMHAGQNHSSSGTSPGRNQAMLGYDACIHTLCQAQACGVKRQRAVVTAKQLSGTRAQLCRSSNEIEYEMSTLQVLSFVSPSTGSSAIYFGAPRPRLCVIDVGKYDVSDLPNDDII